MSDDEAEFTTMHQAEFTTMHQAEPMKMHHAEPMKQGHKMLSGTELKRMVANGGFKVDETTGNRMIRALEDVVDTLNDRWAKLEKLGDSPMLSSTSTAQWMSQHTVGTASDERGLLTQLREAREELPQYIEAIREAKRRYAEADEETEQTFKGFHEQA